MKAIYILVISSAFLATCKKNNAPAPPSSFSMHYTVDGVNNGTNIYNNISAAPVISFKFTAPVQASGISSYFTMSAGATNVPITAQLQNLDSGRKYYAHKFVKRVYKIYPGRFAKFKIINGRKSFQPGYPATDYGDRFYR